MRHRWLALAYVGGILISLLVLDWLVPNAVAAGGQPTEVTISGPGLAQPILVTDPLALPALGIATFMEVAQPLAAPANLGVAYEVRRNRFDHALYYPGPNLNVSYVHYLGLFNGASEYDDHWYRVSPIGDEVMRRILVQHSVALAGNSPGTVAIAQGVAGNGGTGSAANVPDSTTATITRTIYPAWPIAVLSVGIVVAATSGYALGRKRR